MKRGLCSQKFASLLRLLKPSKLLLQQKDVEERTKSDFHHSEATRSKREMCPSGSEWRRSKKHEPRPGETG